MKIIFVVICNLLVVDQINAIGNIVCLQSDATKYQTESEQIQINRNQTLTLFTVDQQRIQNLCDYVQKNPIKSEVFLLTIQNGNIANSKRLQILCVGGSKGILRLIKLEEYEQKLQYLAYLTDKDPIVFDLKSASLAHWYAPDNSKNFEVLLEILPINYELKNIQILAKRNATSQNSTTLGQITFRNFNLSSMTVNEQISYNYKRPINATFSFVNGIIGMPVFILMPESESISCNFNQYSQQFVNKNYTFNETIPIKTELSVTLFGQWCQIERTIEGDLMPIYAVNSSIFKDILAHRTVVNIIESKFTNLNHRLITTELDASADAFKTRHHESIYPGFRWYFYFACILFFGTVAIATFDITRTLLKEKRIKRR